MFNKGQKGDNKVDKKSKESKEKLLKYNKAQSGTRVRRESYLDQNSWAGAHKQKLVCDVNGN